MVTPSTSTAQRNGVNINDRIWDRLLVDFGRLTKTVHSQRTFTGYQVESKGSYITTKLTSGGLNSWFAVSAVSGRKDRGTMTELSP